MNKYKLLEKVGDGTYGQVFKGIEIEKDELVAIKKLKHKIFTWKDCLDLPEVKALSKLNNHKNIIKLREVIREASSEVYLIFDYCDLNLYEYIEKNRRNKRIIPESTGKKIIEQIVNGLDYVHCNGYIHRDLKPENVLLSFENDIINVKIADFGLAKETSLLYNKQNSYNHYSSVRPMTDYICTRWYRAPECILRATHYDSAIDIFALGAIFCEILNLKPIFPGKSEYDQMTKIVNILGTPKVTDWPEGYKLAQLLNINFNKTEGSGLYNELPGITEETKEIIKSMLEYNPSNRITAKNIINSNYFLPQSTFSQYYPSKNNSIPNNGTLSYNNSTLNAHKQMFNNYYNDSYLINKEKDYNYYNYYNNNLNLKNTQNNQYYDNRKVNQYNKSNDNLSNLSNFSNKSIFNNNFNHFNQHRKEINYATFIM